MVKRFDWRIILISVAIFTSLLSCHSFPVVLDTVGIDLLCVWAFLFPGFLFFLILWRGSVLVQALLEPHSGISVNIISAIMNLLIIYIVVNAVIRVFVFKKRNHPEDKPPRMIRIAG